MQQQPQPLFIYFRVDFPDFIPVVRQYDKCICVAGKSRHVLQQWRKKGFKILPLSISDMVRFHNDRDCVFQNNTTHIEILNNKSQFVKYMMNYFPQYISFVHYYHCDKIKEEYFAPVIPNIQERYIIRPNSRFGGLGISILDNVIAKKNHVIQNYIEHSTEYVIHFLAIDGIIQKHVVFYTTHNNSNHIKRGPIIAYDILDPFPSKYLDIFQNICLKLKFSGFANSDFTIVDNQMIIFEINPRLGGSLVRNKPLLYSFFDFLHHVTFSDLPIH